MFQKKNADSTTAKDDVQDHVKLKPLFGIKPGKYLTVLYLFVVIIVLFFIFAFPGIANRGRFVVFTSEPSGAAVRVDDVFFDVTPCKIFVKEGGRSFYITLPGFSGFGVEKNISAAGFASAIFPRPLYLHAELKENEPLHALTLGVTDAAAWSFTGEGGSMYQTPLSISEGAYRSATMDKDAAGELLKAAARFTSTSNFLKDLLRAKFFADNAGRTPSPLKAVSSVADIVTFIAENPAFAVALAGILNEGAKPLLESQWYRKNIIDAIFPLQVTAQSGNDVKFGGNLTVDGIRFVEVEDGIFRAAAGFNYETPVRRFYIAETEVSNADWEAFLAENPEWRADNVENLVEKGLVDSLYLVKTDDDSYPAPSVSGVSWFAADAYCRWFSSKLPQSFSGWTARLPSEIEWEYAAKGAAKGLDGGRLVKMGANQRGGAGLWEWCAGYFAPVGFLDAGIAAVNAVGSPKRCVRGGSWVNPAGTVTPETRAGLYPSSCSPFVSFRPVISQME
jgi:hypothetical protein